MAAHAHFVVEGRILHARFMAVVARYTGESRIAISPASALLQTGGRKPYAKDPSYVVEFDISRSTVTGATEIHRINRAEARRQLKIDVELPASCPRLICATCWAPGPSHA